MAAAIALGASAILQQPSQALPSSSPVLSTSYACIGTGTAGSPFTTVARVTSSITGPVVPPIEIIRWDKGAIGGLAPQTRCNIVTARFTALANAGKSILSSAGPNSNTNQQRIICLGSPGEPCNANAPGNNILFTLRPLDKTETVLNQLVRIGQRDGVAPLHESSADEGDISIDLNEYIRQQVDQRQRGRASSSKTSDTGSAF